GSLFFCTGGPMALHFVTKTGTICYRFRTRTSKQPSMGHWIVVGANDHSQPMVIGSDLKIVPRDLSPIFALNRVQDQFHLQVTALVGCGMAHNLLETQFVVEVDRRL